VRASAIAGLVLLVAGFLLLYLLRGLFIKIIVALIDVAGIVIALALILVGLGLIFGGRWFRGRWRRFTVEM